MGEKKRVKAGVTTALVGASLLSVAANAEPDRVSLPEGWHNDAPSLDALVNFDNKQSNLRAAIKRYIEDRAVIERRYPILYSAQRASRLKVFYEAWQKQLNALDFEQLNTEGRIDFVILRNRLRYDAEKLQLDTDRGEEIKPLIPFGAKLSALVGERLDRKRVNPRDAADTLNKAAKEARALTASLEQGGSDLFKAVTPTQALRAAGQLQHLRTVIGDWNTFYKGYDPMFTWWMETPYPDLDRALYDYAMALEKNIAGIEEGKPAPVIGDPVMKEGMISDLSVEMIPYDIERLIKIGEREFDRIIAEMKRVSNAMGYGEDWKAALEHTKQLAPPPGEVPWKLYEIAEYSESYIADNKAITLPALAKETWRFEMQTPEVQLVNPFFTGGEVTRVSYPEKSMPHDAKLMSMRGNTPPFNFGTVQHELLPGHYLQDFMTRRFNDYRQNLNFTPFWLEGWALYWELELWDQNFARDNPERMGMLFWQLHRAARIIFSLNYQLGRWKPEQCVAFLVEEVGHEPDNALAEVRRTARDSPVYQMAYMIGGLQFRALKREMVDTGKMSQQEFNDAVMIGGSMPVELVRARLLGLPITKDYKSQWLFDGE